MKNALLTPLFASLVLAATSFAHAGDFVNGSFEDPAITPGTVQVVDTTTLPGWTTAAASVLISNGFDGTGSATTWHNTSAGSQYLYIGISVGTNIISQSVGLNSGNQKISFLQADFASDFAVPGGALSVSVMRDSDSSVIVAPTVFTVPAYSDFALKSLTFNAPTSDHYTVSFESVSGNAGIIDNVHIAAVPEPSSLAALGLGGLAVLRRRRKA